MSSLSVVMALLVSNLPVERQSDLSLERRTSETFVGIFFLPESPIPGLEASGRYVLGRHAGVAARAKYRWVVGYLDGGFYLTTGPSAVELSMRLAPFAVGGTVLFVSGIGFGVSPGAQLDLRLGPLHLALACDAPMLLGGAFVGGSWVVGHHQTPGQR